MGKLKVQWERTLLILASAGGMLLLLINGLNAIVGAHAVA